MKGKKHTLETFILAAKKINFDYKGNNYNYDLVNLDDEELIIGCTYHQENFKMTKDRHLHQYGCRKCWLEKNRLSKEEFILRSNAAWNNKYDYSLVNYTGLYFLYGIWPSKYPGRKKK